jgi:hypothetical protein
MLRRCSVGLLALLVACVDRSPPPGVPTSHIAIADVGHTQPVETVPSRRSPGEEVEVEWQGSWFAAVLRDLRGPNRWLVHYEGYSDDWDEVVDEERIRDRQVTAATPEPDPEPPEEDPVDP